MPRGQYKILLVTLGTVQNLNERIKLTQDTTEYAMYSRCTIEYAPTHDALQDTTRDAPLSTFLIRILH